MRLEINHDNKKIQKLQTHGGGKQHASKQPMNHRGSKNKNIENT